jgi:hypothetical protein
MSTVIARIASKIRRIGAALERGARSIPRHSEDGCAVCCRFRCASVWLAGALSVIGCGLSPTVLAANRAASGRDFTVVALPDTQYYAASHPEILAAQVDWIVRERAAQEIALVVHEGDIVDQDLPEQWSRAASSLHVLDGMVPYLLGVGNHDYERRGRVLVRNTLMDRYFPSAISDPGSSASGLFEPGHRENAFEVVETPAGRWLVIALEFGPRDAVLEWASGIASRFAALPAIVVTHAYLAADDSRLDHVDRPDQRWNPHRYLDDSTVGSVNDGEEIWRKLVSRNSNILFVLCGHDLGDGVGRLTSVRQDGTIVHQLLANYQTQSLGGGGYLRIMRFAPSRRSVRVTTYSPYWNQFKSDPDNDFTLDY